MDMSLFKEGIAHLRNLGVKGLSWVISELRQNKAGTSIIVIVKTYLYTFDPLKPHFYIVKLGFTGVYIIFLISAQNIECW